MIITVLKKLGFSENRARIFMERYTRIKTVVSAVFYTLMVFIVIFGISGDVYAGFPEIVPYLIMAVFLFMAFIRIYQSLVDDRYVRTVVSGKFSQKNKKTGAGSGEKPDPAADKEEISAASATDDAE